MWMAWIYWDRASFLIFFFMTTDCYFHNAAFLFELLPHSTGTFANDKSVFARRIFPVSLPIAFIKTFTPFGQNALSIKIRTIFLINRLKSALCWIFIILQPHLFWSFRAFICISSQWNASSCISKENSCPIGQNFVTSLSSACSDVQTNLIFS